MLQRSAKFWWIFGSVAAVLLILAGMAVGYAAHFSDRALPRVTVAGESVSGQTRQELEDLLNDRAAAITVGVTVDGEEFESTLADLGYTVDVEQTVNNVFDANKSWFGRFGALFSPDNVPVVYTEDAEVTQQYAEDLLDDLGGTPQDAQVVLSDSGEAFEIIPAVAGKTIDSATLANAAATAAAELRSTSIIFDSESVAPDVTSEDAQAVADSANLIVATEVSLSDGSELYSADLPTKASWVVIPAADGALSEPTVDEAAISEWVETITTNSNREQKSGTRNVSESGTVLSVVSDGQDGRTANNTAEIVAALTSAMQRQEPYVGEITYTVVPASWDDRVIAAGSENLPYQAAEGEKWINVNLSNHTATAYVGATPVHGPISMVSGAPGTPTKVGQFAVYAKVPTQTMRGYNLDGSRYETPNVPWILYYDGGYALHGAYWRSSFGYSGPSGSHGCVNLPVSESKWFYDWASVGTKVIVHN